MKDYKNHRTGVSQKVVGVRELKTHAAGILRRVRETRATYLLTHRGRAVAMILPLDPADEAVRNPDEASAAWDAFMRAGRRIERRFRPSVDGVRLLSATRR